MSLLFDANLSPQLIDALADIFPGCIHVQSIGLKSPDRQLWHYASEQHMAIVTKDSDFYSLALLAAPGKVILVRLGNCATPVVESLLRIEQGNIRRFMDDPNETLLVLP